MMRIRESVNIAVIMGGPSGEHDISLKSGEGILTALARRHWKVYPVTIPKGVPVEEACNIARRALKALRIHVAFIALHGPFGEDGTIQRLCEDMRIAYTGSDVKASRLGIDKVASRLRFEGAGLPVPKWRYVDLKAEQRITQPEGFSYPLVVKPTNQGSSLGVSVVRKVEMLPIALANAARYSSRAIIEEYVHGQELTVGVLDTIPLPIVEIRPRRPFFDFVAKYTAGETDYIVPAELPEDLSTTIRSIGARAHAAIGARHFSRADILLRHDGAPVLLELNTIPGFTPTSLLPKAAAHMGTSYEDLCEQIVLMAWQNAESFVNAGTAAQC